MREKKKEEEENMLRKNFSPPILTLKGRKEGRSEGGLPLFSLHPFKRKKKRNTLRSELLSGKRKEEGKGASFFFSVEDEGERRRKSPFVPPLPKTRESGKALSTPPMKEVEGMLQENQLFPFSPTKVEQYST